MPMIGLGTWQYNDTLAQASLATAFSMGYRHVDTAYGYENQVGVGKALAASGLPLNELFITSKVPGGLNASATTAALDASLVQLGVAQVDLMLLHWAAKTKAARQAQWLALEAWAKQGKARAIGLSHYCKYQTQDVLEVATLPVALNQNQYHVGMGGDTQPRLHDKAFMEQSGILYEAYSSLCGPCDPPDNKALITGPLVSSIGKVHNKTGAQVALRWVVQQGSAPPDAPLALLISAERGSRVPCAQSPSSPRPATPRTSATTLRSSTLSSATPRWRSSALRPPRRRPARPPPRTTRRTARPRSRPSSSRSARDARRARVAISMCDITRIYYRKPLAGHHQDRSDPAPASPALPGASRRYAERWRRLSL